MTKELTTMNALVECDKRKIAYVIRNMVMNAIENTPKLESVIVTARLAANQSAFKGDINTLADSDSISRLQLNYETALITRKDRRKSSQLSVPTLRVKISDNEDTYNNRNALSPEQSRGIIYGYSGIPSTEIRKSTLVSAMRDSTNQFIGMMSNIRHQRRQGVSITPLMNQSTAIDKRSNNTPKYIIFEVTNGGKGFAKVLI